MFILDEIPMVKGDTRTQSTAKEENKDAWFNLTKASKKTPTVRKCCPVTSMSG